MTAHVRRWSVAPAIVVLAVGLAACGGDNGGSGGEDLTYEDSPLNTIFAGLSSWGDMSEEEMQAQNEEQNRKVEELVAQCMAEQGFDYKPNTDTGSYYYSGDMYEGLEPIEYARQYGYGMTTWEDTPSAQEMNEQEPTEWVDPNADVYESMSDSERAAWDEALWGAPQEWDEDADMEEYEWNWEDSGCYGVAQHQVYEVDSPDGDLMSLYEDPQFAELFEAMGELYTTMQSDPRMAELNKAWANCMADAGFPDFASPEEAQNSINDALNALYEEIDESAWEDPDFTGPDMTEVKKVEIETATADFTCRAEVDYDNEQLRIQFDIEQKFIDENRAAVDALLQAAETARG